MLKSLQKIRNESAQYVQVDVYKANSKSGCCMAKPTISGAMTKAAALSPL